MREIEEPTGPAVSVIVPVYNTRAELVSACVDSILAQTLVDFEIILANDGSEQSVTEGLDALADCDGRIRVLHLSHGGQAAAREAAVLDAQGEYVAFVDSDDEVLPKFLEEAVSIARAEQADYVNGTALVIGSDGVGGGGIPCDVFRHR